MRLFLAILFTVLLVAEAYLIGILAIHGRDLLAWIPWPFLVGALLVLWTGHARGRTAARTLLVGSALLAVGAGVVALTIGTD